MVNDRDISYIKQGIDFLIRRGNRKGLYAMVAIAMMSSIDSCCRTKQIIENYQQKPQVQVRNVIGNEAPERFYEVDGHRVYLEIDGKSVESYFPRSLETEVENSQKLQ
ncbi:MAG: hypothetical protein WCI72_02120 [archaeon]